MNTYLLLLRDRLDANAPSPAEISPEDMQQIIDAYHSWSANLAKQDLLLDGKKLTDGEGRVLTSGPGGIDVKDGPFTETKEVVGGFYLIRAESFEHAVKLCEDHPHHQFGSIEIRGIDSLGDQPE